MANTSPPPRQPRDHSSGLRVSPWNLLLAVPLLMLVTSWFNFDAPRLFGMPFFYWYQFAWVPIGVISVWIVYVKTAHLDDDAAAAARHDHTANHEGGDR